MKQLKFHPDEGYNGQAPAKHLRSKYVEMAKGLQVQRLVWKRFRKLPCVFVEVHLSVLLALETLKTQRNQGWDDSSQMNWEGHFLDLLLSPT